MTKNYDRETLFKMLDESTSKMKAIDGLFYVVSEDALDHIKVCWPAYASMQEAKQELARIDGREFGDGKTYRAVDYDGLFELLKDVPIAPANVDIMPGVTLDDVVTTGAHECGDADDHAIGRHIWQSDPGTMLKDGREVEVVWDLGREPQRRSLAGDDEQDYDGFSNPFRVLSIKLV